MSVKGKSEGETYKYGSTNYYKQTLLNTSNSDVDILTVQNGGVELNAVSAASSHGGYIDFHYGGSTADYTSRIIEAASGILTLNASKGIVTNTPIKASGTVNGTSVGTREVSLIIPPSWTWTDLGVSAAIFGATYLTAWLKKFITSYSAVMATDRNNVVVGAMIPQTMGCFICCFYNNSVTNSIPTYCEGMYWGTGNIVFQFGTYDGNVYVNPANGRSVQITGTNTTTIANTLTALNLPTRSSLPCYFDGTLMNSLFSCGTGQTGDGFLHKITNTIFDFTFFDKTMYHCRFDTSTKAWSNKTKLAMTAV